MKILPALRLVSTLCLRNLLAHKMKSLIVGVLLAFGTFLVVIGSSLLSSVESAMEGSVTNSLAGHLQVYSSEAKDKLALFGEMNMGSPDVGEVPDFMTVESLIKPVENVASVVPMGIAMATVFGRNEIDTILNDLRAAVDSEDEATQKILIDRVQSIVETVRTESASLEPVSSDPERWKRAAEMMERVSAADYWATFQMDKLGEIDGMENHIAPSAKDGRLLYLRTLGTDIAQFSEVFDRFYIVDGEPIPPGKRGYLFSKRAYEDQVKNKVAREFDAIYLAVSEDGVIIAEDTLLQEQIARNARQYQRIVFHLEKSEVASLTPKLQALLPDASGDLDQLMQALLTVTDATLESHYRFFYDEVAPLVPIYEVEIGDEITLRSFTKSGYLRAVNVPVYGTFHFKGLEDSELSGATNLTDLVTFRDLYGKMSEAQRSELDDLRADVGVQDVDRESAEDMLFGDGGLFDAPSEPEPEIAAQDSDWSTLSFDVDRSVSQEVFDNEAERSGLVLNAAVMLEDPTQIEQTRLDIEAAIADAGVPLQVLNWQEAAGIVGQLVVMVRIVLIIALVVIFVVALVIINNSMVMATLDRTGEIGTMRAIGAQRAQVIGLFLAETLTLGLFAGGIGLLASTSFIGWLGQVGIPAPQDAFVLLFSGPRLFPGYGGEDLLIGLASVVGVSVLSTLYPALLAARVEPVVAMRGKE